MQKEGFFDKQKNIKAMITVLIICCIALFIGDIFVPKDHTHFPWENFIGFYAVFGFVVFVVLVLLAKHVLRPIVKRKEDYYD